jgi:hypothetical protein
MIQRLLATVSLFAAATGIAHAQEADRGERRDGLLPNDAAFAIVVENDAFADGNDRNYTNGVQASFLVSYEDAPGWLRWLGRAPSELAGLRPQSFGFTLGHTIFTPEDISAPIAPPDQHPYAGWAYTSLSLIAEGEQNRLDQLEITVGLVGPSAGGEWVQREFHDLIEGVEPRGWDAQLHDEVAFAVDYERRYRREAGPEIGPAGFDVVPSFGVAVGTLRTEARLGAMARFGDGLDNDYGPPRIRPALAGAGLLNLEPGARMYFFVGAYGRAVAHNIFLDGNTYRDSASVDRRPFVGEIQAGAVLQFGGNQLSYTFVRRTEEFETQTEPQQFAAITLARRW